MEQLKFLLMRLALMRELVSQLENLADMADDLVWEMERSVDRWLMPGATLLQINDTIH